MAVLQPYLPDGRAADLPRALEQAPTQVEETFGERLAVVGKALLNFIAAARRQLGSGSGAGNENSA